MKKIFILFFLSLASLNGFTHAQAPLAIPNGSFEQWSTHSGYNVSVLFFSIPVYDAFSTPSIWDYPSYPVNQSITYMGMNVNINTAVPLVKASQVTGGVPSGSTAVKLQTFMLEDIINPTVLNLASGNIDPWLTQQIMPSILSTGVVNINAFIPILTNMMAGSGGISSLIATLANEDINDYITGGLALGDFHPGRLTGSYKYHSNISGDNGGVLLLGTRYNTTTHRRDIVGGGFNIALTDTNAFTPFEVEYLPLGELIPGSANLEPDSLIVFLFSSAGNNRQQGSYLCLDNLMLWSVPDTVWRTVTVTSNNESWGSVSGGGSYPDSSLVALTAEPSEGYHFIAWNDGDTVNPRQVLVVSDTAFSALFATDTIPTPPVPDTVWRTVTVTANVDGACEPYGSGLYVDGDTVEIGYTVANAMTEGGHWEYLGWNDGTTDNPRQIVVTSDTSFVVLCQWIADSVGIENVNSQQSLVNVYPNPAKGQCIVTVSGNAPAVLTLYTADGRLIKTLTTDGSPVALSLPGSGLFLLYATTPTGVTTCKIVGQ